ncbi:SDR family NAD(P)-dependent oxidoreductase [Senegalimassilia anaerobia]
MLLIESGRNDSLAVVAICMYAKDTRRRETNMGYFTGKTIIITGAGFAALKDGSAGSIGFGIATAFAKEGANLAITGRNVKKLEAAKERLESEFGIRVLPIQADVNAQADNQAVVQAAVDQVMAEFGRIDALVNNAQASASGVTIADHTTAQFDLALYSGLYAAFYYMQACYPHLKETKGSVVNFASGAGLFGNYGQCAYAAAKEGIRGLTRVAATEWGPDGINANVVCPLAWTAALENFKEQYPEAYEANVHMPPMGHYGNVETEIGRAVVQLCGPDFKFMSGETITLEGGMGLRP